MSRPIPITRDLVLLGGGHTHALVLKKWAMAPLPGAQVTLVNPQVKALYTGMLPGHIAGHYGRCELDIDLVRLARRAGARLVIDHAIGIDTAKKRVHLSSRPAIAYDTLSVDIGITSKLPDLPGFIPHGLSAKPLGPFADAWAHLVETARQKDHSPNIAVIGAGVAGVELALAMAHRLQNAGIRGAHIQLIDAREEPLREIGGFARRNLLAALHQYGVELVLGAKPLEITEEGLRLDTAPFDLPASFVVSAAGATPHPWLSNTGLALESGYIAVDQYLQSIDTPHVFAAGDCAHFTHATLPKAGVFAVRQAPVLFRNLQADLSGRALTKYRPQKTYLKLISKGRKSAVTDKWGIGLSGKWVWKGKNYIDKAFMKTFHQQRGAPIEDLPQRVALGVADLMESGEPQCGGCGAKVGRASLLQGLGQMNSRPADSLELQKTDDAAIVRNGDKTEVFSTDHLKAFGPDAWLLAKVAAIHALGDIWAMGGQPETILCNIILPPLAPPKQITMIEEIMASANAVFKACGTHISGGHTSGGAELTIGFSVAGRIIGDPVMQSGAKAGDVLVLTKPIGTGTVLAAEMRQLVDGGDYEATLSSMCRLMTTATKILATEATAMTDVTGFGLAGHLLTLLEHSGVSARLKLDNIPVLPGAETLSAKGIRSSLWSANAGILSLMSMTSSPRADLLFDPQTCGGLLASIPSSKIDQVIADFEAAGEPIWRIGEILPEPPFITVVPS